MDWDKHWGIYFLKIKSVILLQVVVSQLDQTAMFHNYNQVQLIGVDGMDAIAKQFIKSRKD